MELQSRFAFLLQPIRDLTKNWDVDVAAQLDDYLSEVSGRGRRGGAEEGREGGVEGEREDEREGGKEKGRGVRDLGKTVQEGWTDKMVLV